MGDLLLKQKPPPLHNIPSWQNRDLLTSKHFPPAIHKHNKNDFIRANDIHYRAADPTFRTKPVPFRHSDPTFRHSDSSFRPSEPPFRSGNYDFRHVDLLRKPKDLYRNTTNLHDPPHNARHLVPLSSSDSSGHDFQKWRETGYYPTPLISYPPSKANGDHYFLAPYYRNVMPPPPNLNNSQKLLMIDSRRRYSISTGSGTATCHCRSKSMEDVRTEVVEIREDRWPNNHRRDLNGGMKEGGRVSDKRRSMDNLGSVDVRFCNSPPLPTVRSPRRIGRFQVITVIHQINIMY